MTRLTTVSTSRASADQRAGRAGRTEPGVCYRLWSKLEQGTRLAHLPAEITQVDLAGLALELAAWKADPATLAFLDPPPTKALAAARDLLVELGALAEGGSITPMGRSMLGLPVHPRLAHMVIAAPDHLQGLACIVAALVDERDIMRGRADALAADLAHRVRLVAGDERDERADRRVIERVRDRALDIAGRARIRMVIADVRADHAGSVLALAFPDRIGVRRGGGSSQPGQFQLRTGGGAWVAKDDPLAREQFIVAADLDGNRTSARVRLGAGLDADELEHALAHRIERRTSLTWDRQRNDLVERVETRLGNMTIADRTSAPSPSQETTDALVERVVATRLAPLDMAGAATFRARVAFARAHDTSAGPDTWPDLSDKALIATVDEWLAPYLPHATGRADLERLDLAMLLTSQWDWDRQQHLAELVPPTFTTPTGREVRIDYSRDLPTASVRVQDLFGITVHPSVMGGRVPVALELLSPADRPIQITSDLPGFWRGTWAEVRKEMAGRYPKHHWPVDPAAAPPKRMKP